MACFRETQVIFFDPSLLNIGKIAVRNRNDYRWRRKCVWSMLTALITILSLIISYPVDILQSKAPLQVSQCIPDNACGTLFSYGTGAVTFLFIIVCILIFVFIYDNMRRGRKVAATTT